MLYRIIGHSRDNGQRMTLEVDAKSKADAERQAQRQNLQIIRIEAVNGEDPAPEKEWNTLKPRRTFKMPWLLIALLLVAGAGYYFWPTIASLVHEHMPQTTRPAAPPEQ